MGSGASADRRYPVGNANREELFNIVQDLPKEDISECRRQLLLEALEINNSQEENGIGQAHGSARGTSSSLKKASSWNREKSDENMAREFDELRALHLTLRERSAVLDNTADISYHGSIKTGARRCYASFPGKYTTGWDALIQQLAGDSVGCVFLCTPKDGLGKHEEDPEGSGECYCARIYGQREKWKSNDKRAPHGCYWYHIWLQKVTEAVAQGQKLQVVFFPNDKGLGKVRTMEELARADLWDDIGCGASQKAEIATLDLMKEREPGSGWEYDEVDVAHFLQEQFHIGTLVDAWYEDARAWRRGTLVDKPKWITKDPAETKWRVKAKDGESFESQHVRHVSNSVQKLLQSIGRSVQAVSIEEEDGLDDLVLGKTSEAKEKLFEALGHDALRKMMKDALPPGIDVGATSEQLRSRSGMPSVAIRIRMKTVEALQHLRDQVLSGDLEAKINKNLEEKLCSERVQIDKTLFCKLMERSLLSFSKLTPHQSEKCEQLRQFSFVNLLAPAGAGKTFVAVQYILDIVRNESTGRVLYVAPSKSLGYFFLQWLATVYTLEDLPEDRYRKIEELFGRVVLLHDPYNYGRVPQILGSSIGFSDDGLAKDQQFLIAVYDEAHHIFRPGLSREFSRPPAQRTLLLSDDSQSFLDHTFTEQQDMEKLERVTLDEVIRCSQRVVSGAAPFLCSAQSRKNIRCCGPPGPPLKSFLFEASDADRFKGYARHTANAILYITRTYPGLSLHRRLALLVPNEEFLVEFKKHLKEELNNNLGHRKLLLKKSEDAMCFLHAYLLPQVQAEAEAEVLILDTIRNVAGLEYLFAVSIGLDAKIETRDADRVTRAQLYQSITRAQLLAMVVNELVPGGWLEFLHLLRLKEEEFNESKALAETHAEAAEKIMMKVTGSRRRDAASSSMESDLNLIRPGDSSEGSSKVKTADSTGNPRWKPTISSAKTVEDPAPKDLQVRDSLIWDTADNAIIAKICELRFNPFPSVLLDSQKPRVAMEPDEPQADDEAMPSAAPRPGRCHLLLSGRFNSERVNNYMKAVKRRLEERRIPAYMVQAQVGQSFAELAWIGLSRAKGMVAFCTSDYGAYTGAGYETFHELEYAHDHQLQIFPIRLCEEWPPAPQDNPRGTIQNKLVFKNGLAFIDDRQMNNAEGAADQIADSVTSSGILFN